MPERNRKMTPLDHYAEIIGPYQVAYTLMEVDGRRSRWVWGAELIPGRSPLIPLPARKHGAGDTLTEARNHARECLPTFGTVRIDGIDHTQTTEM